ncbi:MAG: LPS export ABC transporter periplasmic protein LptC [Bacteroidota bacterium]
MKFKITPTFFVFFASLIIFACQEKAVEKEVNYTGPTLEVENIELNYGDSARVIVKMKTALELDLQNQDKVYPKEVRLFFYDPNGMESTTIRSDSGRYFKSENHYKLMGNILIIDKLKNQNLTTTELIWAPDKKIIYTHKPVDLTTPTQVLHGMGMQANQDFTQYSLGSSSGLLNVKE